MKVLIVGATGMLGSAVLRYFHARDVHEVVGSCRSAEGIGLLPVALRSRVISGVEAESLDSVTQLLSTARPAIVVNCVGIVKQLAAADDPLTALPINSLLPHRLARLCALCGARLIHVSTDCVFSGATGSYREDDPSDAKDLYGRSKYLGEVAYPHAITLRTSIVGRELRTPHGLVDWFLSQTSTVRGYRRAIFSGLPTVELARVMHDFILPRPDLNGLYHVSADPIDKYSLLLELARAYGKVIEIVPDDRVVIDRSLDSSRFRATSGYLPDSWPELVARMRDFG